MTRIGVVGAGRVGAVLAAALRGSGGHEVVAVAGQSVASSNRIQELLPGVPVAKPTVVARACDLLLVTVPDDMLDNVVNMLSASGAIRSGQYVVHTSGMHGLAVLHHAAEAGAHVLAMHPAMTFTGTRRDLARLPGSTFGVTATEGSRPLAVSLVADLGGSPVWIPEDRRTLYHAALSHGANHLVTLVSQAMDLLRESGADDPAATLGPLLGAALDNTLRDGDAALTGPLLRGDVNTLRAHLADIAVSSPGTLPAYAEMARATASRAVLDGRLSRARGAAVVDLLDDALTGVGRSNPSAGPGRAMR